MINEIGARTTQRQAEHMAQSSGIELTSGQINQYTDVRPGRIGISDQELLDSMLSRKQRKNFRRYFYNIVFP